MKKTLIPKKSACILDEFVLHYVLLYAPVAQLDRVSDSDSEGRAFESHRAYQKKTTSFGLSFFHFYSPVASNLAMHFLKIGKARGESIKILKKRKKTLDI